MRQREDKEFAEILNRIRERNHTEADIEVLKERILNISPQHPDYPISLTHLFSTNMAFDQHNPTLFLTLSPICCSTQSISCLCRADMWSNLVGE
jgi:fructosamine-3-kinase